MLIDTHAHLNFKAYDQDREEVIKRCQAKPMAVINVGAQYQTSQLAVELAKHHDFLYATIGLHPLHVFDEPFNQDDYRQLITDKVVAIGECGLDFFHPTFQRVGASQLSLEEVIAKQKEIFLKHIQLAKEKNLPLMLHGRNPSTRPAELASLGAGSSAKFVESLRSRDVYREMLEILKQEKIERAVFHCYGGDLATAQTIVSAGYSLGIDGPVTFKKKSEELQQVVKEIPLESLLTETDSCGPYLTPEPHRGQRNEPIYAEFIAQKIAELKGLSTAEVIEQTWQNAKNLFKI